MEMIICLFLFGFACIAVYSAGTSNKVETKSFEEIEEEEKEHKLIRKEFLKTYKKKTQKELEKELSNLEEDYENLIILARKKYSENNNGKSALDVDLHNNIVDWSYDYRFSINFSLATKYEVISQILEEGLYSIDTTASNYTIFANLKYATKEGIEKITKYSARIKFDFDEGQSIGFLYSDAIKKKRKDLGKMTFLPYSYINKVKAEDEHIIIYLKHAETMKKSTGNSLTIDYVVENDNLIMTFETETPKEICSEINKYIKKNKNVK